MASSKTSNISRISLVALMLGMLGCDHVTKGFAEYELAERGPVTLISGAVELRYAQNRGMAFSLERYVPQPARKPLIALGGLLALGLIALAWYRRRGALTLETAGFALIVAGALGNLLDRAFRGYVVDFIHVEHWPIFNIADVSLVVGLAAIFLAMYRDRKATPGPVQPA